MKQFPAGDFTPVHAPLDLHGAVPSLSEIPNHKNVSKLRPLLSAAILALCAHCTAAPADTQVLNGVAAVVNEEVVTFSQVRELTGALEASLRANFSGNVLTERTKEIRLRALNDLIDRQLILQEFKKMKGQIPPHAIDDRVNVIIREEFGGDKSAFLRTIAAQGFTMDGIRKMEEEKIIVQAMRSREVKSEPLLAPGAVESYYRQHIQEWTANDQVKLSMIKINSGTDREKSRKMIQEIREKIVRGADFASLAKVYSEDSTQDKGGDWGWIKRGDLNPEMEQVVFRLPTGKISDIIELNQTYYLMLAEQKKGGVSKPLKEVRNEIEARLLQVERQKDQQEWLQRLRKKAYVKIY
jgi:parvulin-like peptidyl-prolyl isomerase